ncbi:MAG: ribonuclease P protein component [Acidobacteriota bacterium]
MSTDKKLQPLRSSRQFRVVYDRGVRFHTPFFSLFILESAEKGPRLGITVTRKVGPAVVRNRCKRRLRELARRHTLPLFEGIGCDIVINAKTAMITAELNEIGTSFARTLRQYHETVVVKEGKAGRGGGKTE